MGSRIRFTKAKQVFETYPELSEKVALPTADPTPQEYAQSLLQGTEPTSSLTFFAHALPKREAVWWGTKCVTGLDDKRSAEDEAVLELVENWVREGDEEARVAVHNAVEDMNGNSPSLWIGRAASWSGGSLSPNPDYRVDMPPHLTAVGVNVAMQVAIGSLGPKARTDALETCISAGLSFAEGGVMPVVHVKGQDVT
ncbi:hypothetical protein [Roseibium sp. MMSF_3544]|uniref:DUF6931 family protein n=1 Tax=unclassified Roseibium TaxID=2629323 RepID=UPI00273E4A7F|nr:hypothetical protein [Roseibium sp. MMSF_3544]